jgi:hypothetical protein
VVRYGSYARVTRRVSVDRRRHTTGRSRDCTHAEMSRRDRVLSGVAGVRWVVHAIVVTIRPWTLTRRCLIRGR